MATDARAATYAVGTTSDTTGTCETPASGTCSLRQLINYENGLASTPSPADTIDVPAGLYFLKNGELSIQQSVTIAGAGARSTTIDQDTTSPTSRVFNVQANSETGVVAPNVTISGVLMESGTADSTNGFFGGDIINQGATLTLSNDEITEGTASSGGGISNDGGTMTVTHSLVYFNHASTGGADSGGIQNFGFVDSNGVDHPGKFLVDNTTITGNTANLGGGIMSWNDANNTTTVTDSTIAYNDGGTRSTTGGGLLAADGGAITVQNSIVANNTVSSGTASNCGTPAPAPGVITSLGHNLDSGSDCGFTSSGDLQNTDPMIVTTSFTGTAPQNWGGNTDILPVDAGSPAVDAVPSGASGCGGTDQIGTPRPQGTGCDIGAYEAKKPPPPPPPTLGKTFNASVVSGLVLIKLPAGTHAADRFSSNALNKGTGFVPLTERRQLPTGTQVDARQGAIKLIAATGKRLKTQTATFSSGLFKVGQTRGGINKGLTTLTLLEGLFKGAPSHSICQAHGVHASAAGGPTSQAARLSSRVLQTLHARDNHGSFRTRGRYSAATVRGTVWDTIDRCDGTLTKVHRGTVLVRDFKRRKTIKLHAGQSYLARATLKRHR